MWRHSAIVVVLSSSNSFDVVAHINIEPARVIRDVS